MDLARWKIVKTIVVSTAVLSFAGFAVAQGADPTLTATVAIPVVGLIAGIEFSELVAAMADVDDEQ